MSKQDLQLAAIECASSIFEEHVLAPGDDGVEALLERWITYYEREVFPGGCLFATAGMEFANRDVRSTRPSRRRSSARSARSSRPCKPTARPRATPTQTPPSSPSSCTRC